MPRAVAVMFALGLWGASLGCRDPNPAFTHRGEEEAGLADGDVSPADAAVPPVRDGPSPELDLAAETPGSVAETALETPASERSGPEAARDERDPGPDLTTGLVGHWKLDEGAGTTAFDSSGNGHNGTLELLDGAWAPGRIGGAIEIPSTARNSGIRAPPTPAIDAIKTFTVASWAYRTSIVPDRYMALISRQLGTSAFDVYNLGFIGDKAIIEIAPDPGQVKFNVQSPKATPLRQWIHLAATFDGSDCRLYFDGVEVASFRYPYALPRTTTPVYLGTNKNPNNPEPMVGRIDEVLLYSRALPAAAIAALAAGALPR